VCVYCGSRPGSSQAFAAAAREAGARIGLRGWQLVCGGGRAGLMGEVADATLAAGGRVVGVIPHSLMERELGHTGVHELHVVQRMHERKRLMAEHSDTFLALPGGIGAMEEPLEVWTRRQFGYHDKPVGLLNTEGYYDALRSLVGTAVDRGFVLPAQRALLEVDTHAPALLHRLGQPAVAATEPDDYSRM
jgi:uncharacterized protein (TIGR00730 family)